MAEAKLIKHKKIIRPKQVSGKAKSTVSRTKSIIRGRPPESLLRFTGFTMYKVAQHLFETTNQHLAACGVKGRSFCALHVLISEGPSTQQSLCDGMWIDRATMVAVIDELETLGFVERRSDPSDRRVHRISVTKAGRKFHHLTLREFEKIDHSNFGFFTPEELSQLRQLLERLMQAACTTGTTS